MNVDMFGVVIKTLEFGNTGLITMCVFILMFKWRNRLVCSRIGNFLLGQKLAYLTM